VALFGGEYQEGVLTAYCYVDEVAHIELNGHILVPLAETSPRSTARAGCDAQANEDWPPRGLLDDDGPDAKPRRRSVVRFAALRNIAKSWLLLFVITGALAADRLGDRRLPAALDLRLLRAAPRRRAPTGHSTV